MKRATRSSLLALAIGAMATGTVFAQIPRTISFQGVLADAAGTLVPDGPQDLTISIYDASTGGTPLFSETQRVTVVRGVFNAIIGATDPNGIPTTVTFDQQYYLGVRVGTGVELAPRTPFTSVPYALNAAMAQRALAANTADTAAYANTATLADTSIAIRGGHVVSFNGQQGPIEILGAGATTITRNGNQFVIRSTDTSSGGIRRIDNFDGSLVIDPPQGPFVTMFIREQGVQTHHLRDLSITTAKIIDQQITTRTIADGAVTNAKLGALSISNDKIQTGAVDSRTILNGTIITEDLADNSVTSPKIVDGQVLTQDIGDLQVTNAKLGPSSVSTDKIQDGQVMTADIADLNVTNGKLAANAVTTDKIQDGQVQTNDIADLNVTTAKIADANVTLPKISPTGAASGQAITYNGTTIVWGNPTPGGPAGGDLTGTYPNPTIAPNAVTSAKILDGTIVNADVSPTAAIAYSKLNLANSIVSADIFDGTIANVDLAASSVNSTNIVDGQVMTADIADGNVTLPKINTAGALNNQSIMFNGATAVWGNPAAASLVLPFSQTADISGPMFSLTNTNTAGGGMISYFESRSSAPSVRYVNTNANGTAGSFENNGAASTLMVTNGGTGTAGQFSANNGDANSRAVHAANAGSGYGVWAYSTNGMALYAQGDNNTAGHFQTQSGGNAALRSHQFGTGNALQAEILNAASGADVIFAQTNGLGRAAFLRTGGAANDAGLLSENYGTTGGAARFFNSNTANNWPTLQVMQRGTHDAAQFAQDNPLNIVGDAIEAYNVGGGAAFNGRSINGVGVNALSDFNSAGRFASTDASNANPAVAVQHDGVGRGVQVELTNGSNPEPAVYARTVGGGNAGGFYIANGSSAASAIVASTAGPGNGIHSTAQTGIGVAGVSTSGFGVWGFGNGTATGVFAQSTGGRAILASAGAGSAGLEIANGRAVFAYSMIAAGGIAPTDKTIVLVNETAPGLDATRATVTLPGGVEDGTVMVISTNDADGGTISYTDFTGAVNYNFSRTAAYRFVRVAGVWVREF